MKRKLSCLVFAFALLLSGCSWMDGQYYSATPHLLNPGRPDDDAVVVYSYMEIKEAIEDLVEIGASGGILSVPDYEWETLEEDVGRAVDTISANNPVASYAVETISYEVGNGIVSLEIFYRHGRGEIQRIKVASGYQEIEHIVQSALEQCSAGVVFKISGYHSIDFTQIVQSYADQHPDIVMELPAVAVNLYPETGETQIVEMLFTYQTSREELKNMQNFVKAVFASARLYVVGDDLPSSKLAHLYSFLMRGAEQYTYERSITPAYSLLRHGVGDGEALASVFAALCNYTDMDCRVVTGSKNGEPYKWNLVFLEDQYFHLDLLYTAYTGKLRLTTDDQMDGYVWDYTYYPPSPPIVDPDSTQPTGE